MIVYLTEQGSNISISGDRIVVKKGGNTIGTFLTKDLDQIVIMGNISLSTQAIKHFLSNKVDVVFSTFSGKYLGRLVPELGKNIVLRRLQLERLSKEEIKLGFAKSIVEAKAENSIQVIRKFNYYRKSEEVVDILNKLIFLKKSISSVSEISSLLGVEGAIANTYFSAFDHIVSSNIKFEKRTKRPPQNEFNALLSFGYTILLNLVRTMVNITGLDPYFGSYHSEEYGRPSMVLDLMEEFRSVAVDYVVIKSLNKNLFTKSDFVRDTDAELPVSLTVFGRKKFISLLEKRFNTLFWYDYKNKKLSLREIIRYQTYIFAKAIIEDKAYVGFRYEL